MIKMILTRGAPASGKTTWANAHVKKHTMFVNVNRDDLRKMLFGHPYKFSKARERAVTDISDAIIRESFREGKSVIISDTNLNSNTCARLEDIADEFNAKVEYKDFYVELDELLRRNELRADGVPARVVKDMHYKHCRTQPGYVVKPDSSLPHAIIVDVDGTLAKMGSRSPYDWVSVGEDEPHTDIISLVSLLGGHEKVIIMTGRDGSCLEETETWLKKHGVRYDEIYIRAAGDMRKDSIVKEELFRKNVESKYNVLYVIDDRNQVVDMWRSMGLRCLQVAEGDF